MRIHLNWNKAKVDDWMNEGNDNQLDMEKNAVSIERQHKNEELIKRLIKTEAAIKKAEADIKNSEKQIQQIKKARHGNKQLRFVTYCMQAKIHK